MQIQSICSILGETGCCLFSFLYAIGKDPCLALKDFNDLVNKGLIASDATVQNYTKLGEYYNHKCEVVYANPEKYEKDKLYLGRWTRPGHNHFEKKKNGKVIWSSLDYSKCVEQGVLSDIRIIKE